MDVLELYINTEMSGRYENTREYSWRSCYELFSSIIKKDDFHCDCENEQMALQLGFYLASWGMYRGSSFLLDYSYKIHEPVIKELLKHKNLHNISLNELDDNKCKEIIDLKKSLQRYYGEYRENSLNKHNRGVVRNDVSDTLISKIMLGTLACTPAYDEYFIKGLKKSNVAPRSFSEKSLQELCEENKGRIVQMKDFVYGKVRFEYPDMKLVDMYYWKLGRGNV